MAGKKIYEGGCLCGHIRFVATAPVSNPHTCSCKLCQRHTGALTVAWVEFPRERVAWVGPGGAPTAWRSSDWSSRAFCSACGSSIGAIDDKPTSHCFLARSILPTEKNLRRRPIPMLGEGQSGGTSFQMQVPTNNAVSFILRD